MRKKLVIASGNNHKIKEIREMLSDYDVIGYKDLGYDIEVEETGKTFYENALIKAQTIATATNMTVLADDSGICVEALNGEPGIYSARYAGDGNDIHNNQKLLKNMEGKTNRKAKFVCCMVCCSPTGEIATATGETYGEIMTECHGENGFGYDPLFFSTEINKCLGIASSEEKNKISHRSRALKAIKEMLL